MAVLSRQALRAPETFDAWLEALRRAIAAQPDGDFPPCPRCGRFDLQLRFVADPGTRIGLAAMWSEFCGHGIRVSRVSVPADVAFVATDARPDVLAQHIPPFIEIGPSGPVEESPQRERDLGLPLIRLLNRNGPLSTGQIATELGVPEEAAADQLHRLEERGAVVRTGRGYDVADRRATGP